MALLSFKQYRASKNESSPATRNKMAAFWGLQPMYSADVFGHATPIAPVAEKLLAKLKKSQKKDEAEDKTEDKGKKKKPKKKSSKKHESVLAENEPKQPDRSFDAFIKKAEQAANDIDKELSDAEEEADRISKEASDDDDDVLSSLRSQARPVPPGKKEEKPKKPEVKKAPSQDIQDDESEDWDKIFSASFDKDKPSED